MKTREDIEKMFFDDLNSILRDIRNHDVNKNIREKMVNKFIFETIIPEVLKSVIYRNESIQSKNMNYLLWYTDCQDELKQKAKELYWIDL